MSMRRTSLNFNSEAMAQLNAMREMTHISDNAELIRIALSAYSELVDVNSQGRHIHVQDCTGAKWPYSPYIKLEYPGLRREAFNKQAEIDAKTTKPFSFFFSGEIIRQIDSLRKRSFLSSNADTVRVALSAFKELLLVAKAGDHIYIVEEDGHSRPYSPFQPWSAAAVAEMGEVTDGGAEPQPQSRVRELIDA